MDANSDRGPDDQEGIALNDSSSPARDPNASPGRSTVDLVSVVIPAAGESQNLPLLLDRIKATVALKARRHEVIVVVPGPEDPTADVARSAGARVLVQKRPGYGGALKEGILAAQGDYVVTMDADLSHPPEFISDLLDHRDDAEVVICSRYVRGASARMPASRTILSRILNYLYSRALDVPLRDLSSGFRIYQRHVFDELEISGEKFDVLEEIVVKIYSLGWRVAEIPFDYMPRASGRSHASLPAFAPHFLGTLFRLFKIRNHYLSADYDARAYDSLLLPQRYWQRRRFTIVTRMAGGGGPRLDIGCGSSRIIQSSPDSIGLDIELPKLRFLRNTNPRLVQGSTYDLPFPDGAFRIVIHSQVIERIPYNPKIFRELNRVLKLGGTLVIGTVDYGHVQWRVIERLYKLLMANSYGDDHITPYTRYRLTELLADAGFGIVRYAYILGAELIMECVKREDLTANSPSGGRKKGW
jgi:glycosyltransferase involved in cell wall biosynthesis